MTKRPDGLNRAIKEAGGVTALAQALRVNRQAIYQWRAIPANRVIEIEGVTGVPREELRPDLYRRP